MDLRVPDARARGQPSSLDRRVKALAITEDGLSLRGQFFGRLTSDAGPLARLSGPDLVQLRSGLRSGLRAGAAQTEPED